MARRRAEVESIDAAIEALQFVKDRLSKGQVWTAYKHSRLCERAIFGVSQSLAEQSYLAARDWGYLVFRGKRNGPSPR